MGTMVENLKATEWLECDYVKISIDKGYTHPKDPALYTLTESPFKLYVLDGEYYYPEDLQEGYSKDDILFDFDSVEFWAYSDNPINELIQRLIDFESICNRVMDELKVNHSIYGMIITTVPTNPDARFIFDFVKSWVSFYNADLLTIPDDIEQAHVYRVISL